MSIAAFFGERVSAWRQGTREGQLAAFVIGVLVTLVLVLLALTTPFTLPVGVYAVPLVIGGLTLRTRFLAGLVVVVGIAAGTTLAFASHQTSWVYQQSVNVLMLAVVACIVIFVASRDRSGLPGTLGKDMLMELNERLRVQGMVPRLPQGWQTDWVIRSAGGAQFSGDFFIANVDQDDESLELVVVDVSGKGVRAATKSLQFAGALGGLIGTLPPAELLQAANEFLLRQQWDFSFATAVNLRIDLERGDYRITSAGHPPALRWNKVWSSWDVDEARGTALGMVKDVQFDVAKGHLEPGEAVMLYTDGVIESRDHDVDEGIAMLQKVATAEVRNGWDGIAARIVDGLDSADDDRAVVVLYRER